MCRLITYLNSLFLGVILGMIFVATVKAAPHRHEGVHDSGIMISYQILGTKQQATFLLIAGRVMQLADLPPEFCGRHVGQGYRLSSPVLAISIAPVRPAKLRQAYALKK